MHASSAPPVIKFELTLIVKNYFFLNHMHESCFQNIEFEMFTCPVITHFISNTNGMKVLKNFNRLRVRLLMTGHILGENAPINSKK